MSARRRALVATSLLVSLACTGRPVSETPVPAPVESPVEASTETPRATAASPPRVLRTTMIGEGEGPLVVLLHGWGADGDDLVPLARVLHQRTDGVIRFAVLEAPLARPGSGRAWWHLELGRDRPADRGRDHPRGLDEARRDVLAWLRESGADPSETMVVGFSQGAMLAMDVGLRAEEPLAGVGMLSGGPVDEEAWRRRMGQRALAHAFVSHGRFDPVLSFDASYRVVGALRAAGAEVVYVPFDGGHAIPEEVVEALASDLRVTLIGEAPN